VNVRSDRTSSVPETISSVPSGSASITAGIGSALKWVST
jgi:hypothetical protein